MSIQNKIKILEGSKTPRRPLPKSDISEKRKEIFDLSKGKRNLSTRFPKR